MSYVIAAALLLGIRYTGLHGSGWCLGMLWQIRELDVLTALLAILIKVPVEVRSVLLPTFASARPVFIYTLRIKFVAPAGIARRTQ